MGININSLESLALKVSKYTKACGKKSILQTKANPKSFQSINKGLKFDVSDFAYHGSPFNFDFFDPSKIGAGEGIAKRGIGLYLYKTKRIAPFYANLRCKDAPTHFGNNGRLENADPHIYSISGLRNLNLKRVGQLEAKSISKTQKDFETLYPHIDGLEVDNEICIFPKSINKINIFSKEPLEAFVTKNKEYPFRSWTKDESRIDRLGLPAHHLGD